MIKKLGLDQELKNLLSTRVYMGISAGSMVTGESLMLSTSAKLYSEEVGQVTDDTGLSYVNFQVRPHLNSPYFPKVRLDKIKEQSKESTTPIYAIDDQTAIVVKDNLVEVVTEGTWEKIG